MRDIEETRFANRKAALTQCRERGVPFVLEEGDPNRVGLVLELPFLNGEPDRQKWQLVEMVALMPPAVSDRTMDVLQKELRASDKHKNHRVARLVEFAASMKPGFAYGIANVSPDHKIPIIAEFVPLGAERPTFNA